MDFGRKRCTFQSFSSLASCLASMKNVANEQVSRLFGICPALPSHFTEILQLTSRDQDAILAMCYFLCKTENNPDDRFLEYLMNVLYSLRRCRWHFKPSLGAIEIFNQIFWFSSKVSMTLSYLASEYPDYAFKIVNVMLTIMKELLEEIKSFSELSENSQVAFIRGHSPSYFGMLNGFLLAGTKSDLCDHLASRNIPNLLQNIFAYQDEITVFALDEEKIIKIFDMAHDICESSQISEIVSRTAELAEDGFVSIEEKLQWKFVLLWSILTMLRKVVGRNSEAISKITIQKINDWSKEMFSSCKMDLHRMSRSERNLSLDTVVDSIVCCIELIATTTVDDIGAEETCKLVKEHFSSSARDETQYIVHLIPLLNCCLDTIGTLAEKFPHSASYVLETFRTFILKPAPVLRLLFQGGQQKSSDSGPIAIRIYAEDGQSITTESRVVRDHCERLVIYALKNAVRALKSKIELDGDAVEAFIASVSNRLYSHEKEETLPDLRQINCIVSLGYVAIEMSHVDGVLESVLSILQQKFCRPPSQLDAKIIDQFASLLLTGHEECFQPIMNILIKVAVESSTKSYTTGNAEQAPHSYRHCSLAVMNALQRIANDISSTKFTREFLVYMLEMFVQMGLQIRQLSEEGRRKASAVAGNLGVLIPIIASHMKNLNLITDATARELKLFRDFWLYVVLMGFGVEGSTIWPKEWYEGACEIAVKAPVLLGVGHLRSELQYNLAVKNDHIAPGELTDIRQSLLDALGNNSDVSPTINKLDFAQCAFLCCVYHLENLRIAADTWHMQLFFKYLEDKAIQRNKFDIWKCVRQIGDLVFKRFLELISKRDCNRKRDEELEAHTQFLLVKFNHEDGSIRRVADRFLSEMVDRFPYLLWNDVVVKTMLDLLSTLDDKTRQMGNSFVSSTISVPRTSYQMIISPDPARRKQTVDDFANRCNGILQEALKWAPAVTRSLLHQYLIEQDCNLSTRHFGIKIAIENFTSPQRQQNLSDSTTALPLTNRSYSSVNGPESRDASTFIAGLKCKSRFAGQIEGMHQLPHESTLSTDKTWPQMLIEDLASFNEVNESFISAMYRICAYIAATKGNERILIESVCFRPVRIFTQRALEVAITCWEWLLTARKDLEDEIQSCIHAAWLWTIEQRMGMFTPDKEEVNPLALSESYDKTNEAPNVGPHDIWLEFLVNRFKAISYYSRTQVEMFAVLVNRSLSTAIGNKSLISHHIENLRPRFRLLHLGLLLLQGTLLTQPILRNVLRERVYHGALDYFSRPPTWPVPDIDDIRKTLTCLIEFWNSIYVDKKNMRNFAISASLESLQEIQDTNSLNAPLYQYRLQTDTLQGWLNTVPLSSGASRKSPNLYPNSKLDLKNAIAREHLKKRALILPLVKREIERLSAWRNPKDIADLRVSGEDSVATIGSQFTVTEKMWKECVRMAWRLCPRLSIHLAARFKENAVISKELKRLVQSDPSNVCDIPEALALFTSDISADSETAGMVNVLVWKTVPPVSALAFFSQQFHQNPYTAQYAVDVLRSYPPDTTLLYVPQLVQALRYDSFGFIEDYILWCCRSSQLLAHQIIWNMKSNVYLDEDCLQKDPNIGGKLENLIDRMTKELTGPAMSFYEREFDFFDKVTQISGKIRPYPKSERKTHCQKLLKEIQVDKGVYLPSNPKSMVIDIDYNSGIPMQSAAKAPFLARFKVQDCGFRELEEFNSRQESSGDDLSMDSLGPEKWLGCIFKVGDDVRQDMLALQVIQLFKNIFDHLGIDVFLMPYKVVATAPGCGVIECVPNAKSRDQLGRQAEVNLYEYFVNTYGDERKVEFQEARSNFIKSMAAYSVVSYILQIKDRHNGNIMINDAGYIIHIDFGFMFESSPGGNMGFEPDMKLTYDWVVLMGSEVDSYTFRWFIELCVRAYLAVRNYMEEFTSLVSLMLDTGLPCFRGETLKRLRMRFAPQLTEREAANNMLKIIENSHMSKRAQIYDYIQLVQNQIPC